MKWPTKRRRYVSVLLDSLTRISRETVSRFGCVNHPYVQLKVKLNCEEHS